MNAKQLEAQAKVFNALSDPTRLLIVDALRDGEERTGKEIAEKLGITIALFCHHATTLQQAGLLIKRKQGQSSYNRLDKTVLSACLNRLNADL